MSKRFNSLLFVRATRWSLFVGLVLAVAGWCVQDAFRTHPKRLEQDAYIWQMVWKDALRQSVGENAALVRAWRVLFAHVAVDGRVRRPDVDAKVLRASERPVVVVVRIEGQIEAFEINDLRAKALGALREAHDAGLTVAGIEIDHDCASAKLARYTQFLASLREGLGTDTRVFITALPAWLGTPTLPALLAQADEAILQVHAVANPRHGLFNATQALAWVERFNAVAPHPFRVALPTYGSRVRYDSFGNIASVESETPLANGGSEGTELVVSPAQVQGFLDALSGQSLARLQGIAWFRLPTGDDARAWHTNTWRALLTGVPLHADLRVTARPAESPGLFDIVLVNRGETDAVGPGAVDVPSHCSMLDGVNGYQVVGLATARQQLKTSESYLLKPKGERAMAWARCEHNPEHDIRASP